MTKNEKKNDKNLKNLQEPNKFGKNVKLGPKSHK